MLTVHFIDYVRENAPKSAPDSPNSDAQVQLYEEFQQQELQGLVTEQLAKRLQSDSQVQSEDIRQAKETMEKIISSVIPDAMKELSRRWHRLRAPHASSLTDEQHTKVSKAKSAQPH